MTTYFIQGPTKLSGEVCLQGSKNSALKHLFIPLLTNSKFTFLNIPNITSSTTAASIVSKQGAQVKWINKNTVSINTQKVKKVSQLTMSFFFIPVEVYC